MKLLIFFIFCLFFVKIQNKFLLDSTTFDIYVFYGNVAEILGLQKNETLRAIEIVENVLQNKSIKPSDWILKKLGGIVSF